MYTLCVVCTKCVCGGGGRDYRWCGLLVAVASDTTLSTKGKTLCTVRSIWSRSSQSPDVLFPEIFRPWVRASTFLPVYLYERAPTVDFSLVVVLAESSRWIGRNCSLLSSLFPKLFILRTFSFMHSTMYNTTNALCGFIRNIPRMRQPKWWIWRLFTKMAMMTRARQGSCSVSDSPQPIVLPLLSLLLPSAPTNASTVVYERWGLDIFPCPPTTPNLMTMMMIMMMCLLFCQECKRFVLLEYLVGGTLTESMLTRNPPADGMMSSVVRYERT